MNRRDTEKQQRKHWYKKVQNIEMLKKDRVDWSSCIYATVLTISTIISTNERHSKTEIKKGRRGRGRENEERAVSDKPISLNNNADNLR